MYIFLKYLYRVLLCVLEIFCILNFNLLGEKKILNLIIKIWKFLCGISFEDFGVFVGYMYIKYIVWWDLCLIIII